MERKGEKVSATKGIKDMPHTRRKGRREEERRREEGRRDEDTLDFALVDYGEGSSTNFFISDNVKRGRTSERVSL